MSHLIEDSQFQALISSQIQKIYPLHSFKKQDLSLPNRQNQVTFKSRKTTLFSNIFAIMPSHQIYTHKSQFLTLNVLRNSFDNKKFYFQGLIFQKANKFMIKYKQKRILFGKEWMKQKISSKVKVSLSFNTGQIRLFWPEVFYIGQQSILQPKATFKKLFGSIFTEFVTFFEDEFAPICKKIFFCNHSEIPLSEDKNQDYKIWKETNQQKQKEVQIMQRYLYMSTVIDTFQREKQSYKRIQERVLKQKEHIVKVQNNIDMSFSNIGLQLNLFTQNSIKKVRKKLESFGALSTEQHKKLQQSFRSDSNKCSNENQCQYIFNGIGILKIENKKRFISSGGTCNVYMAKMIFQYIFSDDSKFWIEENKKNSQNAIEKCFAIKQGKQGFEDKIKHQNQIVRQMKGGFSIYLPKYYRIQNLQKDAIQFKTENLVIMDFFKGQTLDQFTLTNKDTLSFWTKIFIVRNIVNGLRFISSYKIVHLDLKPNNIIVINGLLTKLIDFSQSYHSHVSEKNFLPGISLPYSCPDILSSNQQNFDQKYDIFSLGVIMFELFINNKMFQIPRDKMFKLYESKQYMKRVLISPQQIQDENLSPIINIILILILRCLDPRPQNRPTLNWIMVIIGQVLTYFKGK